MPAFQSVNRKVYLGSRRQGLAGDDVFSRQGAFAGLDPDLPVRVEVAEGQMIAFDPVHDPLANHPAFENARGQLLEGVREQEVGSGNLDGQGHCAAWPPVVEAAPALNLHLGELPAIAVMHSDSRAVRHDFYVCIAARAAHAELVGSSQRDLA